MSENQRVALTTGLLRIPPTYFAVQHAELLRDQFSFRMHAIGAEVNDPDLSTAVTSGIPQVLPWSMTIAAAVALTPWAQRRQRASIEEFSPSVVHQHFATWAEGALDAAQQLGIPAVTTLHGYDVFAARPDAPGPLAVRHRRSAKRAGAESDLLLAVSRYLASAAVDAGFPAERIAVHYQGVDADYFSPAPSVDTDDARSVLFVGALETRKGVDDLLALAQPLADAGARLRVVGAGSRRAELDAAAARTGAVDVLGSLDRHAVREELRRATVLVLPTRHHAGWREAAGLVLLEAQSCGTPVVTFESGGAPEMVLDGRTGIVAPDGDTAAFVESVLSFIALDRPSLDRWGQAAREFVVTERSLRASAETLAHHYRDVRSPYAA